MTKEEFFSKHGDDVVSFSSYYKYTFTFKSKEGLEVYFGGKPDEIYRFEVTCNPVKVKDIDAPLLGAYLGDKFLHLNSV